MTLRSQERYVFRSFVTLTWRDAHGNKMARGRCVDFSESGIAIETAEAIKKNSDVYVWSEQYGSMGRGSVRHCTPRALKFVVGLEFSGPFALCDDGRRDAFQQAQCENESLAAVSQV